MTNTQKLELILETIKKHNITAYEIGKNTKISTFAIQKIINGETKKPNIKTLNEILIFLEEAIVGTDYKENKSVNKVREHNEEYTITNKELLPKYHACIEEQSKMMQHIMKLQRLLSKNNISFEDYFDKE